MPPREARVDALQRAEELRLAALAHRLDRLRVAGEALGIHQVSERGVRVGRAEQQPLVAAGPLRGSGGRDERRLGMGLGEVEQDRRGLGEQAAARSPAPAPGRAGGSPGTRRSCSRRRGCRSFARCRRARSPRARRAPTASRRPGRSRGCPSRSSFATGSMPAGEDEARAPSKIKKTHCFDHLHAARS